MKITTLTATVFFALILTGCINAEEEAVADPEKILACAFPEKPYDKRACSELNDSEKRILKCALSRKANPKLACEDLSYSELKIASAIRPERKPGTQFNLEVKKLGE